MKKSIFKGICFVFLIMATTNVVAQRYDYLPSEEKERKSIELINITDYVVEGKVLNYNYFYGDDDSTIYTDISFEVDHWYKGKGDDIIHVIVRGGRIGTDHQYDEHPTNPLLGTRSTYIVLLKKGVDGDTYEYVKPNSFAVYGAYPWIPSAKYHLKAFYDIEFLSTDEFYTFLNRIQGITLPVQDESRSKKKDVFGESSKIAEIEIDETWLTQYSADEGPFHAGVRDILIIRGQNFGTYGNVLFKNADLPDSPEGGFLEGLDSVYVLKWSSNEIKVMIPSLVLEGSAGSYSAGSGPIIVERLTPDADIKLSDAEINIEYSILNKYYQNTSDTLYYPVSPYLLGREHCLNGMVFTLHTSFEGNIAAQNAVQTALTGWSNELGITLDLERQQDNSYYFHNEQNADYRNIIYFDPTYVTTGDEEKLMATSRKHKYDDCGGGTDGCFPASVWRSGANIRIAVKDDWQYNPTGDTDFVGIDKVDDFYANIVHEIGHAIGLDHDVDLVNGKQNLMSYQHPAELGIIIAEERINLNQYSGRAKVGAQRIVADSKAHAWTPDFFDRFGVEALSNTSSVVQPTPVINTRLIWVNTNNFRHLIELEPTSFNPNHNYYWLPDRVEADNRVKWACGIPKPIVSTHYVRIKDDACTVSSLYSLPKTIGENCLGFGRDDDDNSVPTNQPLVSIYPNPTNGHFNIQFETFDGVEIPNEIETYIGIYDNLGRLQHQHKVSDTTLRQTTIDISTLPAGTYWVVWFVDGEVIDTQQVQKTE